MRDLEYIATRTAVVEKVGMCSQNQMRFNPSAVLKISPHGFSPLQLWKHLSCCVYPNSIWQILGARRTDTS
jgi:hypothetical protein